MFRAFLFLSKQECDEMTIGEYCDYFVILNEVWKLYAQWGIPKIS
jgi:hypothetical protein